MSKLVIIDGHAMMHRAFHAIPPLSTPKGEPINAVHGVISMLLNVIQTLKPTHLCFTFDEKAPTFRNKLSKTYQAQRPEMAMELSSQFGKIKKFLDTAKIPYYSKAGYEADDVIGTLSQYAVQSTKYLECVIVTGDRDILQVVDDKKGIKLFMPIAGLSNGKLFGEKETYERMGVPPSQISSLKALTGDPSDNYFGVAGIGPVTAIKLLNEFKTVNNIYTHLEDINPKIREKLEAGKESAELSLKLSTIDVNVPIDFDLPQMEKWKLDSSEVVKLFSEDFGFKTLRVRIEKLGKSIEEEKQGSLF